MASSVILASTRNATLSTAARTLSTASHVYRPRYRPALLSAIASCMAAVLVGGVALTLRPTPARGAPTPLHAVMYHNRVIWSAEAGTGVSAEVHSPTGLKAKAQGVADASGRVALTLAIVMDTRGLSTWPRPISPGDTMTLTQDRGGPLTVRVPDLSADVDDNRRRIVGRAPAGTAVTVTVEAAVPGAPPPTRVVADASGRFAFELPGGLSLADGQGGWVTWVDADGHRFDAYFAARFVEITLDTAYARVRSTIGNELEVKRRANNGTRVVDRGLHGRQYSEGLDGRRVLADDHRWQIHAGMPITVTEDGGPLERRDRLIRVMPKLAITIAGGAGVSGAAPAGARLTVRALPPHSEEPAAEVVVTADAGGAFAVSFAPDLVLAAGWRAAAVMDLGDGIYARALATRPRLRGAVGGPWLDLIVAPMQLVTVTLRSPSGAERISVTRRAAAEGSLAMDFDTDRLDANSWHIFETLRPGDAIEVDAGGGDRRRVLVPRLAARSDPDAEAIIGQTEPGARVGARLYFGQLDPVTLDLRWPVELSRVADAGPDGSFRIDLAGEADIEPGVGTELSIKVGEGDIFLYQTAPLALRPEIGRYHVDLSGITQHPITATLRDSAGRLVGTMNLQCTVNRSPPRVRPLNPLSFGGLSSFRDSAGNYVAIAAGDTVHVISGLDEATLSLPPLEGKGHVGADRMVARSIPNAAAWLHTHGLPDHPNGLHIPLVADARGFVEHRFNGTYDIRYNDDDLRVEVLLGRHAVVRTLDTTGLDLDLDGAVLHGANEPGLPLAVTVHRDGELSPVGQASARPRADGAFTAHLRDPAGEPLVLRVGDRLIVSSPGAELTREVTWTVPALTLDVDRPTGDASGVVPEDARLTAWRFPALDGFVSGRSELEEPVRAPDGTWHASSDAPVAPGHVTAASIDTAEGHRVRRMRIEPQANVETGGATVCGVTAPHARVRVVLKSATGAVEGSGEGRASAAGRFTLALRGAGGELAHAAAGKRVEAEVGAAAISFTLDALDALFDPASRLVSVQTRPHAAGYGFAPARTCLGDWSPEAERWVRATQDRWSTGYVADAQGRWTGVGMPAGAEQFGVQVASFTVAGFRQYRTAWMPLHARLFTGTDRVAGTAPPRTIVSATIRDADGAPRGSLSAEAGSDGRFTALARAGAGGALRLSAGDRVTLSADSMATDAVVEPLDFDIDLASGALGHAPAGRSVGLTLTAGDRSPVYLEREADAAGRFSFGPQDLPPQGDWGWADLVTVQAELLQAGGHATVVEWRRDGGGSGTRAVWLPWVGSGG